MSKENTELIVLDEVIYPVSVDEIKSFNETWKSVPILDPLSPDKEDYKLVKKAHIQAVKFRTSIDKTRKLLKSPALKYGRTVDRIAKELQESINPLEGRLFVERNRVEQYEKELEQERINAEMKRVEDIGHAITKLKMIPLDAMGKTNEELKAIYESIDMPSEAIYAERLEESMIVYKDTLSKLETAIDTTEIAEQAEFILAEAERHRLAEEKVLEESRQKERDEFEKEKEEFRLQKEEQDMVIRERREAIDIQEAVRISEEVLKEQEIGKKNAEREAEEKKKQDDKILNDNFERMTRETRESIIKSYNERDILGIYDDIITGLIPHVKWGL